MLSNVVILVLVALLEQDSGSVAIGSGMVQANAGLIRSGQIWRFVTTLTLHVDLQHLSANAVIGGLVGPFAGQLLGCGLAWANILIAGVVGNFFNAWIRPPTVFSALGIVARIVWVGTPSPADDLVSRLHLDIPRPHELDFVGSVPITAPGGCPVRYEPEEQHVTGLHRRLIDLR